MSSSIPFSSTPPTHESDNPQSTPDIIDPLKSTNCINLPERLIDTEKEVGMEDAQDDVEHLSPSEKIAKLLNGKDKEWAAVVEKKGPLQLLDLPLDILKEIMKQVSHTSDLTSVALCHSSLHALAVPHIYSRFDIVWPDAHATSDHRTGVDALTYGLATLVMAEDVFGEAPYQLQQHQHTCTNCGHVNHTGPASSKPALSDGRTPARTRRGNYFAQYTRKFSLGNGPTDWVQEYMITKEGGKMLGTLVALAVARMFNLESFTWDMPTGVLRDVWLALSSLGYRRDGQQCRLEKVWVRWHDNSDGLPVPTTGPQSGNNPAAVPPGVHPPGMAGPSGMSVLPQIQPSYNRVEYPTFSVLPPLRSLSVLDIDELPYVVEMAILIERSKEKLRELRVGIATHAEKKPWVRPWGSRAGPTASGYQSVDQITKQIGGSDGVLGILASQICYFNDRVVKQHPTVESREDSASSALKGQKEDVGEMPAQSVQNFPLQNHPLTQGQELEASAPSKIGDEHESSTSGINPSNNSNMIDGPVDQPDAPTMLHRAQSAPPDDAHARKDHIQMALEAARQSQETQLNLEVLELERVPLAISVLDPTINWSRLTSLTILRCPAHEDLWRVLRKHYKPLPTHPRPSTSSRHQKLTRSGTDISDMPSLRPVIHNSDYILNIKRLQTDAVSPSLIAFLKETLAPNSLEWLFLQRSRHYKSKVSIDSIYKGPIRRHRASLRKLLVDSEDREEDGQPAHNTDWREWIFPRELLTFMTSGRMPNLREAGMALDYPDWHYFLQRLPQLSNIRSIYIPYVADHVHGRNLDSRELALQILDIAALRPDLQICYLGIQAKCFEILETKAHDSDLPDVIDSHSGMDGESDVGSEEDDTDTSAASSAPAHDHDHGTDSDSYSEPNCDSDDDSVFVAREDKNTMRLKLREILFYDDKVSIFKARHGRL